MCSSGKISRVTLDIKGRLGLETQLRQYIHALQLWGPGLEVQNKSPESTRKRLSVAENLKPQRFDERGRQRQDHPWKLPDQLAWSLGKVPGQRQILSWKTKRWKAPRKWYYQWCPLTSEHTEAYICMCSATYMHSPTHKVKLRKR